MTRIASSPGTPSASYCGALASIYQLIEFAKQEGPFHAVFGFSQGAVMASLLLAHSRQLTREGAANNPFASVQCAILVSGYLNPLPSDEEICVWYSGERESIPTPSLHIMGAADTRISNEQSILFSQLFVRPVLHKHEKGHMIPERSKEKELIRELLRSA